ncbi:MAG: carbohydrate ABC transporter permease [Thermaerobacter sp.]|nr:carbohydrate ABC transporter permease [Thermaerobacter sp.]
MKRIPAWQRLLNLVLVGIALLFFLFPVYWMINTALKPPNEWLTNPPIFFPHHIYLTNFSQALIHWGGLKGLWDSLVVSVGATALSLVAGVLGAYAIARYNVGGNNFSFFVLSVLFFPPVVVSIPMFQFWRSVNLIDTFPAMVVQYSSFTVPFVTWILKGFFEDLAIELEESAMVNGATRWQAFWDVALPSVKGSVVATALLAFIFSWNAFTFAVILSQGHITTLPYILPTLMEGHYVLWGDIAAIATLAVVPIVVLAFVLQRYLVRGLSFGTIRESL